MTKAQQVRLVGDTQRAHAKRLIDEAPLGWVMKLGAETRRDAQNRKLHAMIEDLRRQLPEATGFSVEDMKLRFMHALRNEMRFLPDLEGQGQFLVGQKTSTLSVEQFAGLIELIYEYGARHQVRWTDPAERDAA